MKALVAIAAIVFIGAGCTFSPSVTLSLYNRGGSLSTISETDAGNAEGTTEALSESGGSVAANVPE